MESNEIGMKHGKEQTVKKKYIREDEEKGGVGKNYQKQEKEKTYRTDERK
jgi:hypothetical protein